MRFADTELDGINIIVMREGSQLNNKQRENLIASIKEIEKALRNIGDLKSPGVDSYGANFYKKA